MPKRNDLNEKANSQPLGNQQENADDEWEKLMSMKGTGSSVNKKDENGFDKMNCNFYLLDGETCDVALLEDTPHVFLGHNLKLASKSGRPYFMVEACRKSIDSTCEMCSTNQKNVGAARQYIAFVLLDSRGSYDKNSKAFDGKAYPKIFLAPLPVAKTLKRLRDDVGGSLIGKVIRLSKDAKNYSANVATVSDGKGGLKYKQAPTWDGPIPDVSVIYAPSEKEALSRFLGFVNDDEGDEETSGNKGGAGVF